MVSVTMVLAWAALHDVPKVKVGWPTVPFVAYEPSPQTLKEAWRGGSPYPASAVPSGRPRRHYADSSFTGHNDNTWGLADPARPRG